MELWLQPLQCLLLSLCWPLGCCWPGASGAASSSASWQRAKASMCSCPLLSKMLRQGEAQGLQLLLLTICLMHTDSLIRP